VSRAAGDILAQAPLCKVGQDDGPLVYHSAQRQSTAPLAQDIVEHRDGQILPGFVDDGRDGFCAKARRISPKFFILELQQVRISDAANDLLPKRQIDKQAMEIEERCMRGT
jgi:hypothetical protein